MTRFKEKRQHLRINPSTVEVEIYSFVGDTLASEKCDIEDISKGGLCFISNHTFRKGSVLRLTFDIPDSKTTVRTNAVVVHNNEQNNSIFTGVQFRNLSLAESKLIDNYIKNHLNSEKTS